MMQRRGFLLGLSAVLAAPAIVRAESIMRIAALRDPTTHGFYIAPSDPAGSSGAWVRPEWYDAEAIVWFGYGNLAFTRNGAVIDIPSVAA